MSWNSMLYFYHNWMQPTAVGFMWFIVAIFVATIIGTVTWTFILLARRNYSADPQYTEEQIDDIYLYLAISLLIAVLGVIVHVRGEWNVFLGWLLMFIYLKLFIDLFKHIYKQVKRLK